MQDQLKWFKWFKGLGVEMYHDEFLGLRIIVYFLQNYVEAQSLAPLHLIIVILLLNFLYKPYQLYQHLFPAPCRSVSKIQTEASGVKTLTPHRERQGFLHQPRINHTNIINIPSPKP